MFGLSDIFTPSFFIILGILVLFVSLLILHIENKARVHEHQLNSMLSLVSSLAEEVNTIRYNFMTRGTSDFNMYNGVEGGGGTVHFEKHFENNFEKHLEKHLEKNLEERNELISVSDDEEDEEDEEDDEEDDDEDEDEDDEEDDDDNSVKTTIIKLNISSNNNDLKNNELKEVTQIQEIIEIGNETLDSIKVLKVESLKKELKEDLEEYLEEYLEEQEQKNELEEFETENISHKINIKMDDLIDYKKLPLQRLKTIVLEKKLVDDSSKLKKHELLKLLGIE